MSTSNHVKASSLAVSLAMAFMVSFIPVVAHG